jgi:DNA processing protein
MDLDAPRFLTREDLADLRPRLPESLKLAGLWVAGDPAGLARPTVAVVGCRAASDGGRRTAHAMGRDLAAAGVCVISGLALGIDGAAHAGALEARGTTIGLLGGGHRRFFPKRNRRLAEAILEAGGAVASPFAPDEDPRPFQFLQRNSIVAGLSDAVVVVEAPARSGALNTATWAAALGIDVFAVPGDVDRAKAAGCNALIRDGAVLVRDAADVLAGLGIEHGLRPEPVQMPLPADPLERAIVAALGHDSRTIDDLVDALGLPTGAILAALVRLELSGAIERREDLCYRVNGRKDPHRGT